MLPKLRCQTVVPLPKMEVVRWCEEGGATQLTGFFNIVARTLDFIWLNSTSNIFIQNNLIGYNGWNVDEHGAPRQMTSHANNIYPALSAPNSRDQGFN
jgi:hypothetical protein